MKPAKALRYCIIGLVILTVALFALSLHTLFTSLFTVMQGEAFGLDLDKNESTGDWTFTLDANPKNGAILGIQLSVQLEIVSPEGESLAKDSTSVYIDAGGQSQFALTLSIPAEDVQRFLLEDQEGIFEMKFGISTLGDLVGFTQTMRITGEAPI